MDSLLSIQLIVGERLYIIILCIMFVIDQHFLFDEKILQSSIKSCVCTTKIHDSSRICRPGGVTICLHRSLRD